MGAWSQKSPTRRKNHVRQSQQTARRQSIRRAYKARRSIPRAKEMKDPMVYRRVSMNKPLLGEKTQDNDRNQRYCGHVDRVSSMTRLTCSAFSLEKVLASSKTVKRFNRSLYRRKPCLTSSGWSIGAKGAEVAEGAAAAWALEIFDGEPAPLAKRGV